MDLWHKHLACGANGRLARCLRECDQARCPIAPQARCLCHEGAIYSETMVPIFFPKTMSVKLLGVFISNTTIGIRLSMQRLNAVESMT